MSDDSRDARNLEQLKLMSFVENQKPRDLHTNKTDSSASRDNDDGGLTYADAGVDIAASEAATTALVEAVGHVEDGHAGIIHLEDRYLALTTDGVGTKILVAEALDDYTSVGIDCIAMNVNDLIAMGIEPIAFVDYLAIESPNERIAEEIGQGVADGIEEADIYLVGGETAVMSEVISGLDLAGACMGYASEDDIFPREAKAGDQIVGWPSSGIHSNGLTLARKAVTQRHSYKDSFPPNSNISIGEELLKPTRIYNEVLNPLRSHGAHAAAHITGGGWTNLTRMGNLRYVIDNPFEAQPVFGFVQAEGDVSEAEMHRTFNMGTGFVAALAPDDAEAVVEATDDGRVIGRVEETDGDGSVAIRGLTLA